MEEKLAKLEKRLEEVKFELMNAVDKAETVLFVYKRFIEMDKINTEIRSTIEQIKGQKDGSIPN